MAEIFKGLTYDFSGLKKFIVIKRILPHIAANKNFIKMLIDEAKIAVRLSHGNIAQTYDLGKVADDYFIVMEYVDGRTLSQIFKKTIELKRFIPIPIVAYVVSEICNGLDYMHRAKDEMGRSLEIVHRDISPQNIIVSESGNVKIVDFGVAKAAFKLSEMERGVLKGKFAYMSPEQTEGAMVEARSDIFSTGVVLWENLTGRRLFKKKSNAETIEAVQNMVVYPPSAYRNEIPSELDEIVMRALERDPEKRFASAADMSLVLTKFLLKHYPDFKPNQIHDSLQDIFEDEDNTGDLYQEKTMREELTVLDRSAPVLDREEILTPVEETFIIDPQELDFHSVFEEIEVEEPSEITRAIQWDDAARTYEERPLRFSLEDLEDEGEDTGGLPEPSESGFPSPLLQKLKGDLKKKGFLAAIFISGLLIIYFVLRLFFSNAPAALRIEFNPPDAQIALDDQFLAGSSPIFLKGLKPRQRHHLQARREGYEPVDQEVYLWPGWTHTQELLLKRKKLGGFQISSSPPGAMIFIDGQATGKKTPVFLEASNLHFPLRLGLSKGSSVEWQQQFESPPQQRIEVFGDLEKSYGILDVESSPSGAPVKIDGNIVGKTPLDTFQIPAQKKIKLQIELEGFNVFEKEVELKSGENQKIYHALQKKPSR